MLPPTPKKSSRENRNSVGSLPSSSSVPTGLGSGHSPRATIVLDGIFVCTKNHKSWEEEFLGEIPENFPKFFFQNFPKIFLENFPNFFPKSFHSWRSFSFSLFLVS
jgi:hypothetical protein